MSTAAQMTTAEVLTKALELLGPNGEHWYKGWYWDGQGNRCCLGAINAACERAQDEIAAATKLQHVIGKGVAQWNDAPERTFADVKAAFQNAISLAKQSETRSGQ